MASGKLPCHLTKGSATSGCTNRNQGQKLQIPNSKLQRSTKLESQKPTCSPFAPASVLEVWCFELWNFSGAWALLLGVSLKNEPRKMHPGALVLRSFHLQTGRNA